MFRIEESSGHIVTAAALTGKGRQAPYVLTVRATDAADAELFSDTEVYVTVGDVSRNDGVPAFTKPSEEEIAYIAEVSIRAHSSFPNTMAQ